MRSLSPRGSRGLLTLTATGPPFHCCLLFLPGRDSADSDQRKREEDFYYTEVQVKEEPAPEAAAAASPTSASAPIIIHQQALAKPEALLVEQPVLEPALASGALSQSAPSSFWHIQADHAYQVSWWHLPGMGHLPKSCRRAGHDLVCSASPRCGRDVSLPPLQHGEALVLV